MHRHLNTRILVAILACTVAAGIVVTQSLSPSSTGTTQSAPRTTAQPTPTPARMPVVSPSPAPRRFTRDLAQYANAGQFNLPDDIIPAARRQAMANIRSFVWQQWQAKKRGRASYISTLIQGYAPGTTTFYVEPDEAGRWRVALEVQGQDNPQYFYVIEQVGTDVNGRSTPDAGQNNRATGTGLLLKESAESQSGLIL